MKMPVRVVGVGSPNGDDAVAWEVIRAARALNWDAVELHTVEGGQRLLDLLDGCGTLILIDALECAGTAGTLQRFEWPDPRLAVLRPGSTHDMRPTEALELAAVLGLLPPRVVIWAIEGERFDPGTGLSPTVAAVVPELMRRLAAELRADDA